jgi:tetratricopeptide (TPR) repeat protein
MRCLFLSFAILLLAAPSACAAADEATPTIERLIAELGDDDYAVRSRAEEQLLRMGPTAFDALTAAADSKDLEIADRVQYIIQRLQMQWVHRDDPSEVRRVLARFGAESEETRLERVEELARLEDGAGGAALCRIARFDSSPLVSRHAATGILKLDLSADERRAVATAWKAELGKSDRPPVLWIELYLRELDDPVRAIAEWAAANEAELEVHKREKALTDRFTVRALLDRQLERCHELNLREETRAALMAVIDSYYDANEPDRRDAGLVWAMRWIMDHKRWDALEPLEDKFEHNFKKNRFLLYNLAAAMADAGRDERATEFAEQAFNLSAEDDDIRVAIAGVLAQQLGRLDWAEREYRRIIEKYPAIDKNGMEARSDLAIWLHDRDDFQAAADLLAEFCDAIDADAQARRRLIAEIDDDPNMGRGRAAVRGVEARRYFYLACVDEQRKDYEAQRTHLTQAAEKYDEDPDILIALYRLPGGTDDQRQAVTASIRRVAGDFQQQINDYPTLPGVYNQWAWLIANTEGDQKKAVEYSLKSLELAPDEPSYLDTLGRCYYAVGDYEKAVKSQRKAVELAPHYRVMQRQLALFEEALAKQSAN